MRSAVDSPSTRRVGAGSSPPDAGEHAREDRDHPDQQDRGHDERGGDDAGRIGEGAQDGAPEPGGLLQMRGQAVQHRFEHAAQLSRPGRGSR